MLFADNFGTTKEMSTREIQSLKKRIDFYMDHYTLVKKNRQDDITYEDKLKFLSNLNKVLDTELNNRK